MDVTWQFAMRQYIYWYMAHGTIHIWLHWKYAIFKDIGIF